MQGPESKGEGKLTTQPKVPSGAAATAASASATQDKDCALLHRMPNKLSRVSTHLRVGHACDALQVVLGAGGDAAQHDLHAARAEGEGGQRGCQVVPSQTNTSQPATSTPPALGTWSSPSMRLSGLVTCSAARPPSAMQIMSFICAQRAEGGAMGGFND